MLKFQLSHTYYTYFYNFVFDLILIRSIPFHCLIFLIYRFPPLSLFPLEIFLRHWFLFLIKFPTFYILLTVSLHVVEYILPFFTFSINHRDLPDSGSILLITPPPRWCPALKSGPSKI